MTITNAIQGIVRQFVKEVQTGEKGPGHARFKAAASTLWAVKTQAAHRPTRDDIRTAEYHNIASELKGRLDGLDDFDVLAILTNPMFVEEILSASEGHRTNVLTMRLDIALRRRQQGTLVNMAKEQIEYPTKEKMAAAELAAPVLLQSLKGFLASQVEMSAACAVIASTTPPKVAGSYAQLWAVIFKATRVQATIRQLDKEVSSINHLHGTTGNEWANEVDWPLDTSLPETLGHTLVMWDGQQFIGPWSAAEADELLIIEDGFAPVVLEQMLAVSRVTGNQAAYAVFHNNAEIVS